MKDSAFSDARKAFTDMEARGVTATPAKRNRTLDYIIDGHIYSPRKFVERYFPMFKHSRRLATRYDKTADGFLGFVLVASLRMWLGRFVHRIL